ncbi:hypothetical protein [Pseudoalteromonas rubra]|uniref:hypothetical protein n=1 Tax=Pseudoalteromonas rubra TaxID=43658 RepID=UPI000F76E47E|nr:hypothetical protein [Pseudoalteromonas rubra]
MDEFSKQKVREFADNVGHWAERLSTDFSIILSCESLMLAMLVENKKELVEISLEPWTYDKCKIWFLKSQLSERTTKILEAVYLENSAIPVSVERALLEEQVKFKGERWVIHKNDADPFPSSPHAHNYESMLKLHLGNGDLYRRTTKVGTMKKKDFKSLRNSFKKVKMPELEV